MKSESQIKFIRYHSYSHQGILNGWASPFLHKCCVGLVKRSSLNLDALRIESRTLGENRTSETCQPSRNLKPPDSVGSWNRIQRKLARRIHRHTSGGVLNTSSVLAPITCIIARTALRWTPDQPTFGARTEPELRFPKIKVHKQHSLAQDFRASRSPDWV